MSSSFYPGSLLADTDMKKDRFLDLISLASKLKADKRSGTGSKALTGRAIALLFEKDSTRTRGAVEVAAYDQGARVTYLGPTGSHVGKEESIPDTARVLGGMYDAIAFRGFDQAILEELAACAGVPVWNALTDQWHPTQMLADVLTMTEFHEGGAVQDIACCFTGDGRNNVARSLLVIGSVLGLDVRIAAPSQLSPPPDVVAAAQALARGSGARVTVTDDVEAGVRGADFVYTDVWLSMGESQDEWANRIAALRPYRVTEELMRSTGRSSTKFMHCLPSIHNRATEVGARLHARFGLDGAEVTEGVFESPQSIVFEQSANKMHSIKALMVSAMAGGFGGVIPES